MAGTGRPAKENRDQARNRNPVKEWTEVVDEPFVGKSPDLPRGHDWPKQTRVWWEKLRRMPHCCLWGHSDWEYALTTALVHAEVWAGNTCRAAELRLRERELGATDDARRALRIRYVSGTAEQPEIAAEVAPDNVRRLFA